MYELALVSAIDEELEGLGMNHKSVLISSLGIGNLVASVSLTEILLQNPSIQEVIFIGSAGTYSSSICPYPGFASGSSYNYIELGVWRGISQIPEQMPVVSSPKRGKIGKEILDRLRLKTYSVNSPNSISLISWRSEIYLENSTNKRYSRDFENILLENMECFGLSLVCEKKNLGFTSLFAVTNEVGPEGSAEWRNNYQKLGRELCQKIQEVVSDIMKVK